MAYFTSTARQENWLHFNGQALNMDAKSTHRDGKPIARNTNFVTLVACVVQVTNMSRLRCFNVLEAYAKGNTLLSAQLACAAICGKEIRMNQVELIYGLGIEIELRRLDPKLRQACIRTQPARPEAALGIYMNSAG
ncbi:hypothetical protein P692DRAFT_20823691 [Suillus brevipes Sb2]|nr:hypothetical protein P692DRAFT_20823691 [Suillus brevipes Sb2]